MDGDGKARGSGKAAWLVALRVRTWRFAREPVLVLSALFFAGCIGMLVMWQRTWRT